MIPLRLDECQMPRRLAKWQYEDYFPPQKNFDAYKRVLESLKIRAKSDGFDMLRISPLDGLDTNGIDELLKHAIMITIENGIVTISLLQRKLRIGYTRSTRLIAKMEEMGMLKEIPDSKQPTWQYITNKGGK